MSARTHVVVGTAGHIDHGKSTLIRALTGTDPDRLPEEKQRGITIDLGFAHTVIEGTAFSFVDVPGHERFVHNMLAGATGIDLVLLVVAADESVMPQTREHLGICRLLGLADGVVALTRIDLVDEELAELAADEVGDLVRGTFLEGRPIVRVSGVTGAGLDDLRRALGEAAERIPPRAAGGWPRLPIDRVFAAKGFGTVVTGTLQGAPLAVGQPLVAAPGNVEARVRGLQVHGDAVDEAGPQRRVAVNLQGVERDALRRGQVLAPPGHAVTTLVFDAHVEVLGDAPAALEHGQRVRVHHGTAEVMGRMRLPVPGVLEPGAAGAAQVRLEEPLAALPGDRFVLRRYSPVATLAGGEIVDIDPPRWRRSDPQWPARVAALSAAEPARRLACAALDAGEQGFAVAAGAVRLALRREQAREVAEALAAAEREVHGARWVLLASDRLVPAPVLARLEKRLRGELARAHRERPLETGLPPDRLRTTLVPQWTADAFRDWLGRVLARGEIVQEGDALRLASHRTDLEAEQKARYGRLLSHLEQAGLTALPEDAWLRAAGPGPDARPLVAFALRRGEVVRLSDGAFIAAASWRELLARLREEAAKGRTNLDVPEFKELFGLSRKYAIPLLEKLDDQGVTQRVGNTRRFRASWMNRGLDQRDGETNRE